MSKFVSLDNLTRYDSKLKELIENSISDFITKSVDDLVNYYTKSQTYTKTEVNTLIGDLQQFSYLIVEELPQEGANNVLYLVPKTSSQQNNVYDEYVYANNTWEKIGDTQIDLTNYVRNTDYASFEKGGVLRIAEGAGTEVASNGVLMSKVFTNQEYSSSENTIFISKGTLENVLNTKFADYTTTSNLTTLLAGKQDTLVSGTNIKTINGNNILGSGDLEISSNDIFIDGTGNSLNTEANREALAPLVNDISNFRDNIYLKTKPNNFQDLYFISTGFEVFSNSSIRLSFSMYNGSVVGGELHSRELKRIIVDFNSTTKVINNISYNINTQDYTLKNSNNILFKNNTTAFTPTGDYNPATKKYVDDLINELDEYYAPKDEAILLISPASAKSRALSIDELIPSKNKLYLINSSKFWVKPQADSPYTTKAIQLEDTMNKKIVKNLDVSDAITLEMDGATIATIYGDYIKDPYGSGTMIKDITYIKYDIVNDLLYIETDVNEITDIASVDYNYVCLGINEYSNTSTYVVGDYCYYNYTLFKCNTAISTAEEFDSTKWTQRTILQYLDDVLIQNALNSSY